MRKTVLALTAIVVLCICLVGCGSSGSGSSASYEAQFVGTWNAVELTGEKPVSEEQLEAMRTLGAYDVYINLDEGGKATTSTIAGDQSSTGEGTWSADSPTQVTLTIGGSKMVLDYADGKLSATSNNSTVYFKKTEHRDPVSMPSATASPIAPSGTLPSSGTAATSAQPSETKSSASSTASEKSSNSKQTAKYEVSIDDMTVGEDYQGNPALIVTYSWKNNSDETRSFASTIYPKCFQNGVQLSTAFVMDKLDNDGYMASVRPGYGTTLQMAYELKDTENPVDVEVSELANFNKEVLTSKTYEF